MTSVGGYRVHERLATHGAELIDAAESASGQRVRLRSFAPPPAYAGTASGALECAAMLEAARRQTEVASQCQGWSSVVETGTEQGTVWIATEPGDVPLSWYVGGVVNLKSQGLRNIVSQILRALHAYHERWASPMGSLSLRTVLVNRPADPRRCEIRLTDPAVAGPGALVEDDLRALGRLIYRLVEHRGERVPVLFPVRPTEAWRELGRSGEAWCDLVNQLLDPNAGGRLPSIEEIDSSLPVEPLDPKKPLIATGTAAGLLGIAGAVYFFKFYQPALTADQVAPSRIALLALAKAYHEPEPGLQGGWFRDLHEGLVQESDWLDDFGPVASDHVASLRAGLIDPINLFHGEQRVKERRYKGKAQEKSVFDAWRYFRSKSDPNGKDYYSAGHTEAMDAHSTDEMPAEVFLEIYSELGAEFSELTAARDQIQSAHDFLAQWSALEEVSTHAESFDDRGWSSVASSTESGGRFPEEEVVLEGDLPGTGPSAAWVRGVLTTLEDADAVQRFWTRVSALDEAAQSGNEWERVPDAVVAEIEKRLVASPSLSAAAATSRQDDLGLALDELAQIAGDDAGAIFAWTILMEAGSDWAAQRDSLTSLVIDDPLDLAALGEWIEFVDQFALLNPDPFAEVEATLLGLVETAKSQIDEVLLEAADNGDFKAHRAMLTGIQQRFDKVRGLPRISRFEAEVAGEFARFETELGPFSQQVALDYGVFKMPFDDFQELMRATAYADARVQRVLTEQLDRGDARAAEYRDRANSSVYIDYRRATDELNGLLDQIAGTGAEYAAVNTGGVSLDGFQVDGSQVQAELDSWRGEIVAEVAGQLGAEYAGGFVSKDDPRVRAILGGGSQRAGQIRDAATALVGDMVRIEAAFAEARGPTELIEGGQSAVEIRAKWTGADGTTIEGQVFARVGGLTSLVLDRVGAAAGLAGADFASLEAATGLVTISDRPEVYWSAWRELSSSAGRGFDEDVELVESLLGDLRGWIDAQAAGGRKAELASELALSSPVVWESLAGRATAVDGFDGWAERRGAYGVVDGGITNEMVAWNVGLSDLRGSLGPLDLIEKDDEARTVLGAFTGGLGSVGAVGGEDGPSRFVDRLNELLADDEKGVDFSKVGPARLRGWELDVAASKTDADGAYTTLSYKGQTRRGPYTIEFVRVDYPGKDGADESVYLGRVEVPFVLAGDAINALTQDQLGRRSPFRRNQRSGPFVWQWVNDRLQLNNVDVLDRDTKRRERTYAGGENQHPGNLEHPMQNIGPGWSIYVAQYFGCRLPTAAEFAAAVEHEYGHPADDRLLGAVLSGGGKVNLRDSAWRDQHDHVASVIAEGGTTIPPWTPNVGGLGAGANDLADNAVFQDSSGSYSDGELWFERVNQGGKGPRGDFRHLIGNVSEWVVNRPGDFEMKLGASPMPQGVDENVLQPSEAAAIGGSAMQPPTLPVHLPIEMAGIAGLNRRQMEQGFADVGFRLALPAGRTGSLADYVIRQAEGEYLLADG